MSTIDISSIINPPQSSFLKGQNQTGSFQSPFVKGGSERSEQGDYVQHDKKELNKRNLLRKWWHLPYNPQLKQRSRELRKNMTKAETLLRNTYLRVLHVSVLRQKPIDHYIVDFYIPSARLVIELDGDTHYVDDGQEYDRQRDSVLQSYELKVLRFTNKEVYTNIDEVCAMIEKNIDRIKS